MRRNVIFLKEKSLFLYRLLNVLAFAIVWKQYVCNVERVIRK